MSYLQMVGLEGLEPSTFLAPKLFQSIHSLDKASDFSLETKVL